MRSMNFLNIDKGWIFSFKEDVLIIFTILFLGVMFYQPFLIADNLKPIEFIQIAIFAQLPHAAAVYIVSYGNKAEFSQHKRFFTYSPIITIILISGFFIYDRIVLLYINALFDCFHFFRQQYGVEMVTMRKGIKLKPFEAKFHEFFFYATTILPAFYFVTKQDIPFGWQGVKLPSVTAPFSESLFYFLILIYALFIVLELKYLFTHKTFNLAKWLHCGLSIFIWFVCPFLFESYVTIGAFLLIQHSVYSWYFCFKRFQAWDRPQSSLLTKTIQSKFGAIIFYMMTFAVTLIGILIIKTERHFIGGDSQNPNYNHIAITAILGIAFIWNHYWIDAVIWKKKNRATLDKLLD